MIYRTCCIEAGYVGGPLMIIKADSCSEVEINVVDYDKNHIDFWKNLLSGDLPVYESGLDEIYKRSSGRNNFFLERMSVYALKIQI